MKIPRLPTAGRNTGTGTQKVFSHCTCGMVWHFAPFGFHCGYRRGLQCLDFSMLVIWLSTSTVRGRWKSRVTPQAPQTTQLEKARKIHIISPLMLPGSAGVLIVSVARPCVQTGPLPFQRLKS